MTDSSCSSSICIIFNVTNNAETMQLLIVDDERDVQPLFEQRFRKEIRERKLALAFAFSASEALSYLEQHTDETPLVLSDINMPGMSGLELLQHLKRGGQKTAPPKVVMVSAYGDEEAYRQAQQLGADGFLTKPLDFNLLREQLHL
jgi:CheY-like chemotaxis protein